MSRYVLNLVLEILKKMNLLPYEETLAKRFVCLYVFMRKSLLFVITSYHEGEMTPFIKADLNRTVLYIAVFVAMSYK